MTFLKESRKEKLFDEEGELQVREHFGELSSSPSFADHREVKAKGGRQYSNWKEERAGTVGKNFFPLSKSEDVDVGPPQPVLCGIASCAQSSQTPSRERSQRTKPPFSRSLLERAGLLPALVSFL